MKKSCIFTTSIWLATISNVMAVMPSANFMAMRDTPEECLPFLQNASSIEYHYMISYAGTKKSPYKSDVPASCCKNIQYGCFLGDKGYIVQGCADCRPSYTYQDQLLTVSAGITVAYNVCVPTCASKTYCSDGFYGCTTNGSTGCNECPSDWDKGPFTQTSDSGCNFVETDCYLTGEAYPEYPGKKMDQDETGIFQLSGNCYYEK